jgi:hypothetical protein
MGLWHDSLQLKFFSVTKNKESRYLFYNKWKNVAAFRSGGGEQLGSTSPVSALAI